MLGVTLGVTDNEKTERSYSNYLKQKKDGKKMINYIQPKSNWKMALAEIQALQREYRNNEGIMSPYDRQTNGNEIKRRSAAYADEILTGALGDFERAIASYEAAAKNIERAKVIEVMRWDPAKLSAELSNARALAELAIGDKANILAGEDPTDKFRAIYNEAKQTGDIYKMRAAAEVLNASVPHVSAEIRGNVKILASDIGRDLAAARIIPDMVNAEKERADAEINLRNIYNSLPAVSDAIGETIGDNTASMVFNPGPIGKAMRRIKASARGLEVLSPDDPEVCGVDVSKMINLEV
jgi:hypothetical protein